MAGFVVLAVYRGGGNVREQPISVTVWGSLSADAVRAAITSGVGKDTMLRINYVQKSESTFDGDLAEAIARGRGPDIVLLRQDSLLTNLAKIESIPFSGYPLRDFRNGFIEEGELLLTGSGALGLPFSIDPLVMYWNRDIFSTEGIANPPRYWDEIPSLAQRLTRRDSSNITRSVIALGGYDNVRNAKEILSLLLLQSGSKVTVWNGAYTSVDAKLSGTSVPAGDVLAFYMQFSDARKNVQTWGPALPGSESMFLTNRLALYLGFASESTDLRDKSPNLNFDVSMVPQSRTGGVQATFGRLYSLSLLKTSKDKNGSLVALKAMTSRDAISKLATTLRLPPVRRDITPPANDALQAVFYPSGLIAKGWHHPKR